VAHAASRVNGRKCAPLSNGVAVGSAFLGQTFESPPHVQSVGDFPPMAVAGVGLSTVGASTGARLTIGAGSLTKCRRGSFV